MSLLNSQNHSLAALQRGRRAFRSWLWSSLAVLLLAFAATALCGVVGFQSFRRAVSKPAAAALSMQSSGWLRDTQGKLWAWNQTGTRTACWGQFLHVERADVTGQQLPTDLLAPTSSDVGPAEPDFARREYLPFVASGSYSTVNWLVVGWPLQCFEAVHADHARDARVAGGRTFRGVDLDSDHVPTWLHPSQGITGWGHTIVPTDMRWGAMTMNVFFWAALAFPLVHARRAARFIRASHRRRHHCCVSCGYPLGELSLCPECGESVSSPTPKRPQAPGFPGARARTGADA